MRGYNTPNTNQHNRYYLHIILVDQIKEGMAHSVEVLDMVVVEKDCTTYGKVLIDH